MKFEETLNYSEELLNEAALVYWKKIFASSFIASVFGVVAALLLIYVVNFKSWISGSFLAIAVASALTFLWGFFIYRKRSLTIFRQMESPTAKWVISSDHVFIESDAGKSEIQWRMFKNVIKSSEFWLLVYKNNSYSVFPIANVSNEALSFIDKKISEHN